MESTPMSCGCGCGCDGNGDGKPERTEQDKGQMRFLIGTGVSMLAYGGYVVARRRPRWLPLWIAALVTWFTACKYLICARCEYFGEACDFYYLGKVAAKMFEAQPDKTLDTAGIVAEAASVSVLQFLPMLASLGKWKMFLTFSALLGINVAAQLQICCRRCVKYSTDPWKRDTCPTYKLAQKLFD
ncbi:MAG: hypothetical protein ACYC99_05265 [Candidatus Geothermincolia bacterium]